ncbi:MULTISPECIES: hypothetical protein [Acidobacterium]|uniref:Uncharacterized protein n=1 Tax=Acidobacterium capsulatum (strain ATCC 51196 / DSM 11244 / BCRC 80197 / JCM 7670 / NBRC 15755 / NCIMB 13165 / 161) TaxID=240015 RepID=C1F1U2_ACIC5|nr:MULTISPECIES: hypothetical protein [Acidobacterium]ACO31380.1 hypothetical protein ACP_2487 [Acidobacterium capsulatum ATCC 51196]HCT61222.1 hypothetical protein [Acidobacterium sp.]
MRVVESSHLYKPQSRHFAGISHRRPSFRFPSRTIAKAVFCLLGIFLLLAPLAAHAQTDEIQVYDATIAPPGTFNLMLHSNFTPEGRTTPAYPGAIIANHSVNGGLEWAYGVTPWLEQGLYLPIYTAYSKGRGGSIDGLKVRELFVRPHAQQHKLFWGSNFEFSFNYHYWESRTFSAEVRPIIGANLGKWELMYNPVVDTDYRGGLGGLQFNPESRIVYSLNHKWDVAAEEYDGFGAFNDFSPLHDQFHEVWGDFDHFGQTWDIEAGAGYGLTAGSDKWTLKFMISRDLNKKPWRPHL